MDAQKIQEVASESRRARLVLSRRAGEEVVIGDGCEGITVRVSKVIGGRVKLCFEAPIGVSVHRKEVIERSAIQHG